jgi:hypothetical protein
MESMPIRLFNRIDSSRELNHPDKVIPHRNNDPRNSDPAQAYDGNLWALLALHKRNCCSNKGKEKVDN